jgi:membrane protein YqaA with SNARE-associated domain
MGNSLGGLTNVILGRFFPLREKSRWQEKATGWLRRYGAATLLLSWMPVIGDLLCLLAGWMRISWGQCFFLCLGKALRYVLVAGNATGYDVVALIGLSDLQSSTITIMLNKTI